MVMGPYRRGTMAELKDKTVKGVSCGLIENIANKGISFLVGLVLVRLLSLTKIRSESGWNDIEF